MSYYIHIIPKDKKFQLPWEAKLLPSNTRVAKFSSEDIWELTDYLINNTKNRIGYLILPTLSEMKRMYLKLTLNNPSTSDETIAKQLQQFMKVIEKFFSEDSLLILEL